MANIKTGEIFTRLGRRGARSACEVCGANDWTLADDGSGQAKVTMLSMQDAPSGGLQIGGQSIPAFMNVCINCGNVRFHAVGVVAPELMKTDG